VPSRIQRRHGAHLAAAVRVARALARHVRAAVSVARTPFALGNAQSARREPLHELANRHGLGAGRDEIVVPVRRHVVVVEIEAAAGDSHQAREGVQFVEGVVAHEM
jgi:hypothetical protein